MKLLASLIFFTRLPFWKIANVPPVYFKRVVDYWPFVGWLTGGIMAGTLWITAEFLLPEEGSGDGGGDCSGNLQGKFPDKIEDSIGLPGIPAERRMPDQL